MSLESSKEIASEAKNTVPTDKEALLISAAKSVSFFGSYPAVESALLSGAVVTREALAIIIANQEFPSLGQILYRQPDSHKLLDHELLMAALNTECFSTFTHVLRYVTPDQECFRQAVKVDSLSYGSHRVEAILAKPDFKPDRESRKLAEDIGNKDIVACITGLDPFSKPQSESFRQPLQAELAEPSESSMYMGPG